MSSGESLNLDPWLAKLHERFVGIARRRVPPEAAEDLAQDAIRVVLEKGVRPGEGGMVEELPSLAWCFQVLRNAIGNFYQKQKTLSRNTELEQADRVASGPTPLEALEQSEFKSTLEAALTQMDAAGGPCGPYLRALAAGDPPAQMAAEEGVAPAVLYRRLYRCRARLREILQERGMLV